MKSLRLLLLPVFTLPAAIVSAQDPAADDFQRASLGPNWTRYNANSEIVNGSDAGAPAPSTTQMFYIGWTASSFDANQFSEAIVANGRPDTMLLQIWVRRRASDLARYAFHFSDENAGGTGIANPRWEIKYDGVPTAQTRLLATVPAAMMPQPGDTLRLEVRGTSPVMLKGFHNGVQVITATDSAQQRIITSGPAGLVSRMRRGGYTAPPNSPLFASWRGGTTPTLASWLGSYGLPANAALDSDTDGDGFPLLTEYGLALDPGIPDAAPFAVRLQGGELWFDYPVNVDATDVQTVVEYSADLSTWRSTGISYVPLGTTGSVRRMRARIAATVEVRRFARIHMTAN